MKIVIVGAGSVGFTLAKELSLEGYDIAVIESDPARIKRFQDKLDILLVNGSGTDVRALEGAGISGADLLIAVTDSDEVNQVVCMMAHAFGVHRKFARIRNRSFSGNDPVVSKREFHINRIINPDELTVESIQKLVETPGASDTADFAGGEILLRAVQLKDENLDFYHKPLYVLREQYSKFGSFLIGAIRRGDRFIIPTGNDCLEPGDMVYVIMTRAVYPLFRRVMGVDDKKVARVIISGGGRIGMEVARRLETMVESLVLIDEDEELCRLASAELKKALVLLGQPTDEEIVREASYNHGDFFIAALMDDRLNLVNALFARKEGVKRTVVVAHDPEIVPVISSLDIDGVINSRLFTVGEILRFVRRGKILSVKKVGDGQAEIVEILAGKGSRALGKSLRDLRLPRGFLVVGVQRQGQALVPDGNTVVELGDHIVSFVLPEVKGKVEKVFAGRQRITFTPAAKKAKKSP